MSTDVYTVSKDLNENEKEDGFYKKRPIKSIP